MNFIEAQVEKSDTLSQLRFENFTIDLPSSLQSVIRDHSGDSLTFGIRPEDIHVSEGEIHQILTQVELVEPLGNHALLYLRTEKNSFVAQTNLSDLPQHNTSLTVRFDTDKVHLFHPTTGESLTSM